MPLRPIPEGGQMQNCRFYENKLPAVDDLVMVRVKTIGETAAYVNLLEYNNTEGMIPLSELSRRRIRSVNKHIRVGKTEVVQVSRVDTQKGYIDLSKRKVTPEDVKPSEIKYNKAKDVHSILRHVAEECKVELVSLYEEVAWALDKSFDSPHDAFSVAVQYPEKVLSKLDLTDEVREKLLQTIQHRHKAHPYRVRADVEVTCFTSEGIDAIKAALKEGQEVPQKDTAAPVEVAIHLLASPTYVIVCQASDKSVGMEAVTAAVDRIRQAIVERKGNLKVAKDARVVSTNDTIGGEGEEEEDEEERDIFYDAATRLSEKFETKFAQMPAAIASASVKKSKKRRKSQASANDDDEKRTDSAKRRKVGGAGGDSNTNGQQKRNQASKKKSATQSASKAQNAGGTANRKKIAKPVQVVERNTESMSIEDMKTRLLALQRQKTVTEAGSPASSPATGGDSYLAEAKALYHIPMTFDEKVQLSQNVSKLPADKLQKLVKLAAKNNSSSMEVNNREEIELDIESMNNKTLREMEAFVNQTLFRKKGGGPNADVFSMSNTQVVSEIAKLTALLRKRSKAQNGSESSGDATGKKQRSFYDSDSSSDSDESGSGNSSDGESSSGSESSDEESDAEMMRKTRERNLAHQQAMQAAGTPLPSPPYQNSGRT